jgi:hypothetical protein
MRQLEFGSLLTRIALGALLARLLPGDVRAADEQPAPLAPAASTPAATNGVRPRIEFFELIHDFGTVDSGTLVKCDYIFTNTGNAVLEIAGVKPACGCTGAGEFDTRVEPGKTGKIPIQFKTLGYGGAAMKTITVSCNDPAKREITLRLKGNIIRPIDVTPQFAAFTPAADSVNKDTCVLKILNNLDEPITLSDLRSTNQAFQAELRTVREGKEFELRVSALPPFTIQNHWGMIFLKTSTPRMPEITVNCYLNVQPVIAVTPSQISLPSGPLTNPGPYRVNIRNNSTNLLSFSEPAINIEGAKVAVEEVQQGRTFTLSAIFPAGFESRPGQLMEVTVKSTHPKYPVVTIPILQIPGPFDAPVPAISPAPTATNAASSFGGPVSVVSQAASAKGNAVPTSPK